MAGRKKKDRLLVPGEEDEGGVSNPIMVCTSYMKYDKQTVCLFCIIAMRKFQLMYVIWKKTNILFLTRHLVSSFLNWP